MNPATYLITISLPLLTAITIFAMRYASRYAAARAAIADAGDLRALSEQTATRLDALTASLRAIEAENAAQSKTLSGIEAILKQVG